MAKININTQLFKLNREFIGLESVKKKILVRSHIDTLKTSVISKRDLNLLPESEKIFISKWETQNPIIEEIEVPVINSNPEKENLMKKHRYIVVDGIVEYSYRTKTDSSGKLLPKSERTHTDNVKTIFFENTNEVYAIVYTGYYPNITRIKRIIGENNLDYTSSNYLISSDMFTWMFFKFSVFEGMLDCNLQLKNIAGFMGNITDEHNVFKGESQQTSELIITKAFISNGEQIKDLIVRIKDEVVDATLRINEFSNLNLNVRQSEIVGFFIGEDKNYFIPLYTYIYLIPKMLYLYNLDSDEFLKNDMKNFSAKIGEDVILSIIQKNGLKLESLIEKLKTESVVV